MMSSNNASGDLVLEDINTGEKFNLPQTDLMITCGRKKTNQIITSSILASRDHCIFLRVGTQLNVIDSKSANGVYINGILQKPKTMVALQVNDIIGLGCSDLVPSPSLNSTNHTVYVLKELEQPPVTIQEAISNTDAIPQPMDETVKPVNDHKRRLLRDTSDGQVPFKIPKIQDRTPNLVSQNKTSSRGSPNSGVSSKTVVESLLPDIIDITDDNSSDEEMKSVESSYSENSDPPKIVENQQVIPPKLNNVEDEVTSTSSVISHSFLMDDDEMHVDPDTSTNLRNSEIAKVSEKVKSQCRPSVISIATGSLLKKKDDDVQSTTGIEGRTLNNNGVLRGEQNCEEESRSEKVRPVLSDLPISRKKDKIEVEAPRKKKIISTRGHRSEDSSLAEAEAISSPMLLGFQDEKLNEDDEHFLVAPLDLDELNLHDRMMPEDGPGIVINKPSLTCANENGLDQWIKYEPELNILDDDESAYKNTNDSSEAPVPTPLKIKRVKEEPKMRFSAINVVTLSDDEEGFVFPASQLFGDEPENEGGVKIEPENDDSEDHEKESVDDDRNDYPDIIVLSDSEDDADPWYNRLMKSQLNETREFSINDETGIKKEPEETNFPEDEQDLEIRDIAKDVNRESYDLCFGDDDDDENTEGMITGKSKRRNKRKRRRNMEKRDKHVEESEMRVEEPEKRMEEPEKRMEEPEKRTEEPEKRMEEPEKRTEEPEKRMEEPEKRTEEPEKRTEEPEKRVEEPEKRIEEPEKRREKPEKSIEERERQRIKSRSEESKKHVELPEKHIEERERHPIKSHSEESKKHVELPEKHIEELAARKISHEDRKTDKNCEEKTRKIDHTGESTKKKSHDSKRSHHGANEKFCDTEDVGAKESAHKMKSIKHEKRRNSGESKTPKKTDDSNLKNESAEGKSNDEKNLIKIPVEKSRTIVKENAQTIQKEHSPTIEKGKSRSIDKENAQTIQKENSPTIEKGKSRSIDKEKSPTLEKKNSSAIDKEKSRSIDKENSRPIEKTNSSAMEKEKSRSIDKENSRPADKENPVIILTKLDHMRKSLQLVEPPFLAKGKDRGVSCSVKRIDRSIDKGKEASAIGDHQSPQTDANDALSTKATKKQAEPKLTSKQKKELDQKAKQEEYFRMKEQKLRRMKNKWAECLPPRKKQAGIKLTREEKEEIKNDRKEKLKKIADEKKKAAESNDMTHVKRPIIKAKAKVTEKSRNDFLVNEMQDRDTKKPINSLSNGVKSSDEEKQKVKSSEVIKEALIDGEELPNICDKSSKGTNQKYESLNIENASSANDQTRINNSSTMKQVERKFKSTLLIEPKSDEPVQCKVGKKSTNAKMKLTETQKSSAMILNESEPVAPPSFINDNLVMESPIVATDPRTKVGNTLKSLLKQKSSEVNNATRRTKIIKKVSFNDLMTKVQFYEIDPANTMKTCPTKDAPVQAKKRAKPGKTDWAACPKLERFLLNIFRWNPAWLQEQKKFGTMPPVVDDKTLIPMLSKYGNYEDYYNVTEPLLLLEIWYGISKDFDSSEKHSKTPVMSSIVDNSISLDTVTSVNREIRVTTLLLEVVVSKRDAALNAHPVFGDLIFFEYFSNVKGKQTISTIFAYVTNLKQTIIKPFTHFNRDLLTFVTEPFAVLTYTVMTKPLDPTNIQTNRVNRLRNVSYLRSNMRMIQALQYLPISPLLNQILSPKIEDYQLPAMNTGDPYPLVTKDKLNFKQLEAVVRITDAVVQKLPKICLIQGPPGTGKSKVIVNLITEILYGGGRYQKKKMRILVCAPSNAAIDEIVLRLLEVRRKSKDNRFKMVRIGRSETMHPVAKDVSLQELAKREVKRTTENYLSPALSSDSIKEERNFLEAQINLLQLELTSARSTGAMHTNYILRKLSDINAKYELLMNRRTIETMEPKELSKLQRGAENTLLTGADVIACTLTSCYTNLMETTFGETGETISVCIVDEATQCAEAETLIPLMLGARTLVLVGDTNQLPATIISQKAKQYGLDQSLFARIQHSFTGQKNNPIILLNTQYRMSYPVAFWPNRFFYAGMLKNAANLRNLPFHFYKVINLDSTQNTDKFSNTDEASFVANLFYTIMARSNLNNANLPVKVGIITPYNNQKTLITKKIRDRIAPLPDKTKKRFIYEVNTVDSFQGQERDVIIMSCVRSNGIGFLSDQQRLCVALTRAKHSLILCGNFKTFERDPMWHALLSDALSRNVHVNMKATASTEEIKPFVIR